MKRMYERWTRADSFISVQRGNDETQKWFYLWSLRVIFPKYFTTKALLKTSNEKEKPGVLFKSFSEVRLKIKFSISTLL